MAKKKRYLYNTPPRDATKNYYDYLEDVARQNWREWGYPSEDLAYLNVLNDNTYNYKEYYDNTPPSQRVVNSNTHWPDTYKTVYHPTFSIESKYSGNKSQYNPKGLVGGRWVGEDIFLPAPWQLNDKARLRYRNGGSIHIKPENRGKFTATMKRTGKSAEELSHSSNPLTRKRAIFALNARKWHH